MGFHCVPHRLPPSYQLSKGGWTAPIYIMTEVTEKLISVSHTFKVVSNLYSDKWKWTSFWQLHSDILASLIRLSSFVISTVATLEQSPAWIAVAGVQVPF